MRKAMLSGVLLGLIATCAAAAEKPKLAAIGPAMQKFVDSGELAGAVTLVGNREGVLDIQAVGFQRLDPQTPMKTDAIFRIASMTKPITAIGIMILADEKKLSPDDPLEKHLPEFRGRKVRGADGKLVDPKRPVLLRDLLTHTSGTPGFPKELGDLYGKRDKTLAEAIPLLAKLPLDFEPGSKWSYCNSGVDTLGRVIEVVSGQRYEQFLQQRVFDPLGMKDTAFYPNAEQTKRLAGVYDRKDGKLVEARGFLGLSADAKYPIPAGGLCSTAADLARLYRMMLNRGELDGHRILSAESVRTMTALQTGDLTCGFVNGMGFGYGWAVVRKPMGVTAMLSPGTFGHGGAFGTQGWIDPHKNLFVVLMIQRVGLPNGDNSEMRRVLQEIAF